jgi:hypothetical protein
VTIEVCNLGASGSIALQKGLSSIDKVITASPPAQETPARSLYADQPKNVVYGASKAMESVVSGFSDSFQAIKQGGIWQLPSAIVRPAIGGVNVFLGMRNHLDPNAYKRAEEKYKKSNESDSDEEFR